MSRRFARQGIANLAIGGSSKFPSRQKMQSSLGFCGYPPAACLENGGGQGGCDGSLGGKRVPRPGFDGRHGADPGAREPEVPPYLSDISMCAEELEVAGMRIKNAFPRADGPDREVYLRAPPGRGPHRAGRVWRLRGLTDG